MKKQTNLYIEEKTLARLEIFCQQWNLKKSDAMSRLINDRYPALVGEMQMREVLMRDTAHVQKRNKKRPAPQTDPAVTA